MIVGEARWQKRVKPARYRVQAGRFRREVARRRVCAADDCRKPVQRWILDRVLVEDRIKRAAVAVMAKLDVGYVERDSARALRCRRDSGRFDEQKFRLWIDEAFDEPGAGDA